MTTDPLDAGQRQRLAVLHATQEALRVELDTWDLIRCAHWVTTGRDLPTDTGEHPGPDAARWNPDGEVLPVVSAP